MNRIKKRKIFDFLAPFPVIVRSLPSVSQLTQGKVRVDDLLEIDIQDLLGRSPVKPISKLLKIKIVDKVVLISGAGGSIGRELSRQIINLKPKKLILFDVSEPSLYQINLELLSLALPAIEILPILGSVRDQLRIQHICEYYSVNTIYHAAAYKHVPLVEYNQSQGVLNNIIGTLSLAKAAINAKVDTFVLISTDKAVRPTNTMGVTKRIAELILQGLSEQSHSTCFTMVRFGNVLDSSGSVIPLFRKQIRDGGPVTVTDINVVRYFMTIPESVELVIQAGAMGEGGDVFVLDMGEPMKIYDLAVKMIQLSGLHVKDKLNPDGDIEITYTGLRPGEKLYEELLVGSKVSQTENKLIMRAEEKMIDWETLKPLLEELENASINNEHEKIRDLLQKLVPEFIPQSNIVDLVFNKIT
jgi:FlaA1/EpsC-like NDP-sugar epimerase